MARGVRRAIVPAWTLPLPLEAPAAQLAAVQLQKGVARMLYWAAVFFVIAIIAAVFGFGGIAAGAAGIAKVLFFLFLILAVVSLIFGRGRTV